MVWKENKITDIRQSTDELVRIVLASKQENVSIAVYFQASGSIKR